MEQKSMTALISAFARAYHAENSNVKIINDSVAKLLFTDMEFNQIAKNMTDGIGFFDPSFAGTEREALRWITDNHLSPSPLGRKLLPRSKKVNTLLHIFTRVFAKALKGMLFACLSSSRQYPDECTH